jgi:hypothetical protein
VVLRGRPAPMRGTERVQGKLVEFFVHTEASFLAFVERDRLLRRSPLLHMCAHRLIIRNHDGQLARLQTLARDRWTAGPARLTDDELEDRRYRLTALLDDLADEADPADRAALAVAVFSEARSTAATSATRDTYSVCRTGVITTHSNPGHEGPRPATALTGLGGANVQRGIAPGGSERR